MGDGVIGSPQAFGAVQSRFESESPSSPARHSYARQRPVTDARGAVSRRASDPLDRHRARRRRGHPDEVARRRPKVLHGFAGRSLLGHVLAAAEPLAADRTVVVVGHRPRAGRPRTWPSIAPTRDPGRAGRAARHRARGAARARRPSRPTPAGTVLVLPGDTPLLRREHAGRPAGRAPAQRRGRHPADQRRWTTRPATAGCSATATGGVARASSSSKDADRGRARGRRGRRRRSTPSTHALLRDAVGRLSHRQRAGRGVPARRRRHPRRRRPAGRARSGARRPRPPGSTTGCNWPPRTASTTHRLLEAHMRAGVTVVDPATTWVDADVHARSRTSRCCPSRPAARRHHGRRRGATIGPQTHADRHRRSAPAARCSAPSPAQAPDRRRRHGRPVRLPAARHRAGRRRARRHLRRAQEQRGRRGHARCRTCPTSATPPSASTPTSARPPSSSTTTACTSTARVIGNHARTGADNMFVAPVDGRRRRLHRGRLGDHRGRPARCDGRRPRASNATWQAG